MRWILGAIIGDVIGSVYEWNNIKHKNFPLFNEKSTFTDDTVLTVATMDALLGARDYTSTYQQYARAYPKRGYGGRFRQWIQLDTPTPYNSLGNGSAMRVSPVGFARQTLEEVLTEAKQCAQVTHNHPEGIKGAQAISAAIFLSRIGKSKREIKEYIQNAFTYQLDKTLDEIRPHYQFDETCPGSVPEAIIAFLESTDYEDAIRNAISLGGDSDTIACITGGIAEAFYQEIPIHILETCLQKLPQQMIDVIEKFSRQFSG